MSNNSFSQGLGVSVLTQYLYSNGGPIQQDRMIKDKRRSLDRALKYSYQGANVKKVGSLDSTQTRALINPNKLKPDYDDKIISIPYEFNYTCGTIFDWMNTGTKWLIYLQDLTELAYFRGDIRKCSYSVSWKDNDGNEQSTYIAVRGPVETKITFIQKQNISFDVPNASLNIMMPKTKETLEYFTRYSKFYLKGLVDGDINICWRVEATDSISMPGILEVNAVEYYSNFIEDDIKNGIVGGLKLDPIDPNPTTNLISGETFIKPKIEYLYKTSSIIDGAKWHFDSKLPIVAEKIGDNLQLKWDSSHSGQFDLFYGDCKKTIIIESLF